MTSNEESARDITQDVFMKVYEQINTFHDKSHIYTWIHRIAINHTINVLKKERRQMWKRFFEMDFLEALKGNESTRWEPTDTDSPSPLQSLEQSEKEQLLWKSLQSLTDKLRIPFLLSHYEEMSYKEIADSLQLSVAAVETRIHRAKKELIKKLSPLLKNI
jgi:RNA polymerase sigma-70 factor (ECF subfamily)